MQVLRAMTPAVTNSIKGRRRQKFEILEKLGTTLLHFTAVPEEVTSSPKTKHCPIIDIISLPKTTRQMPAILYQVHQALGVTYLVLCPRQVQVTTAHFNPVIPVRLTSSVQTNSSVTEAPMLMMHINPGRAHDGNHVLNSSSPVTNNNEGSINLKPPPAYQEIFPPTGTDQPSLLQVFSTATIGINKKGRQMLDNVEKVEGKWR